MSSDRTGIAPEDGPAPSDPGEMLVIGVGASAGGLDALSELLGSLPRAADFAVMIVQHLDRHHASLLVDLLQKATPLPVSWAVAGGRPNPGAVYVAPPGQRLSFDQGAIVLQDAGASHGKGIDSFLASLAENFSYRAVAVILSGNGSDGAAGVRAVKGAGGIVFAQRPSTASFSSMPRYAAETGCVDRELSPAAMGAEFAALTAQARSTWNRLARSPVGSIADHEARHLAAILRLVAGQTGVDFSLYKPNTIKRRLARRMMLVKAAGTEEYLELLHRQPSEVASLHEDLLINVTEFFRDPECFAFLRDQVLPELLDRQANGPLRIWVPGCATGEEVYSYAMLLREAMEERGKTVPVQIFGTDVSDTAIEQARAGLFPLAAVQAVPAERLRRFFHQTDRGFLIHKSIRDVCIFARQNVLRDAPFSRLDLLSCRNLLIYLSGGLQQRLMPMFHYALCPHGALVLGTSESVGGFSDLFRPLDQRFRVYVRRGNPRPALIDFSLRHPPVPSAAEPARSPSPMPHSPPDSFDAIRETDRIVAARRGPPALLVSDQGEIVQFRGEVMPFLAPVAGRASLKLVEMAREGLATELKLCIEQARERNVRVRRTGLSVMQGDLAREIAVEVTPFSSLETGERFFLVEFLAETGGAPAPAPPASGGTEAAFLAQIAQLRQDLEATRNYLQTTIERHEATNQDLRAANEEVQSSNEELQSTNEELETAKEELQSTNEELSTVNDELHHRQLALVQANNDLSNLIASVHLPILILSQDLTIRRFTPAAEKLFNLIPSDAGRPLSDINTRLAVDDLRGRVAETIDSLTVNEFEVQDADGHWYAMRLRPYKTAENRIEGVVVTLVDIHELKQTIAALEAARDFERAVFETAREPLVALTAELRIRAANRAFYRLFNLEREFPETRLLLEATRSQGTFAALRQMLDDVLRDNRSLNDHRVIIPLPGAQPTAFLVNARQIIGDQAYPLILLSLERESQPPG